MRKRSSFLALVAGSMIASSMASLSLASGCSGGVQIQSAGGAGGSGGDGGGGFGGEGGFGGASSSSGVDAGHHDAFADYTDPGCPDQPPPAEYFVCDPNDQGNGDCMAGDACYIYVIYPDDPCSQETYGSSCEPEGTGAEGDPCGGGEDCAGGFTCVVSGSGNQCVEMCSLDGTGAGCADGRVCEPIDVEGYGGCL